MTVRRMKKDQHYSTQWVSLLESGSKSKLNKLDSALKKMWGTARSAILYIYLKDKGAD